MHLDDPENDFGRANTDNNLLRKCLRRMRTVLEAIETVTPYGSDRSRRGHDRVGPFEGRGWHRSDCGADDNADRGRASSGHPEHSSGTQAVSGTVAVWNLPATQPVSGAVDVNNNPATQPVSGTVAVSNLPVTQPVSGTVAVSNFPATQPVSIAAAVNVGNFPATQPVSGTVAVSNLPATQPVSGTVAVSNFPASQTVAGSVSVANFPANQVVSDPTDIINPLFAASRLGLVDGHAAEVFHVMGRRAGFNSTSVLQDVGEFLGTTTDAFPELTGAESLEVISSNANDTSNGTGARTIRIGYINTSNQLTVSADITLNGTTAVALAFNANFILWMETTTVGSNAVAVGTITLRIAAAGATQEQITAGGNRSLSCRFMVPVGYTGYLTDWGGNAISTTQDMRLRALVRTRSRTLGTDYVFQSVSYLSAGGNGGEELPYLKLPGLCKIKVSTISGATGAANRLDAEFTLLLIAD